MKSLFISIFGAFVAFHSLGCANECPIESYSEKIYQSPRWPEIYNSIEKQKKLESVFNELLLLDYGCLRSVVQHYEDNYLEKKGDYNRVDAFLTFHLLFYAYCDIPSTDWKEYSKGTSDSQLSDPSWEPGDPWLISFEENGVKVIAFLGSYSGTTGSLTRYYEQVFEIYGKRNYHPKTK